MMKVLKYISPYSLICSWQVTYSTMYTDLSCKTSPTAGMLWLKPEQKLMLACLNALICKTQKPRCWLMRHWAIAAEVGTCGRWAGHTASISNCFQPAWHNPSIAGHEPTASCLCKHHNYWSLISCGLVSYDWPAFELIFVSKISRDILRQVKGIPFLLPISFHFKNRWTNKDSNTISTQSLSFSVKLRLKPHVLLWCHIIPDIN